MAQLVGVAYTRYSSDKQQETSIVVQLADIRKFCASHNIYLLHEYVDEKQTGTNDNRKQFQQMIKDASSGDFQLVIVHRMDRWARNVDDARYYKKYLAKYGIKMVSAIEEFDETPEGEFFELMSMGMAELYSKKLSREAKAGKMANAKEGKIHGGVPLLGFKVKGKYYVIDEKEAEAVRVIFDMASNGYGYTKIRDFLNSNGYRRADGKLFTSHFTDILRNRKYIGEYVYNRSAYRERGVSYNSHSVRKESEVIRIPHGLPQIVDNQTFNKVQAILDERRKTRRNAEAEHRKYLLSGVVKCGECGRAFSGARVLTNNSVYYIYRCGSRGTCPSRAINATYLEEYILSLFVDCLLKEGNEEKLTELIKIAYTDANEALHERLYKASKESSELSERIKEYETNISQDRIKQLQGLVYSKMNDLIAKKSDLEQEQISIKEMIDNFPLYNKKLIIRKAMQFREILSGKDFKDMQRLLYRIIRVIRIDNDKIETEINLQEFLNAYVGIKCSIIEKRDYVARPENHSKRTFVFSKLTVCIENIPD